MKKKKEQIVNPLVRFRQKAEGRYASKIQAGGTYGRAVSLDETRCFYIVGAEIGNPNPEQTIVCFNTDFDETTCLGTGWSFYTDERGAFNTQTALPKDDPNCAKWTTEYTPKASVDSAGPENNVKLDYTPGTCHKEGETGNDECLLPAYSGFVVANSIWGPTFMRVGDLADNILVIGFPTPIQVVGANWVIKVNSVVQTGWIPSIVNGNLQISLQTAVSQGDTVTASQESITGAQAEDGRFCWRFYDKPVVNVVGANFWMQESGDRWLIENMGRWKLE